MTVKQLAGFLKRPESDVRAALLALEEAVDGVGQGLAHLRLVLPQQGGESHRTDAPRRWHTNPSHALP